MTVIAKRETIRNVVKIITNIRYDKAEIEVAVISRREDGELEKRNIPISEFYEARESEEE